jgi:cytochrome d ubiquinol oxidase subunit II
MLLFRLGKFSSLAFIASGLSVAGVIGTAGMSLFPFMLPSSSDPNASLIVWDTSSSVLTLQIMAGAAAIFLPINIVYTGWVYYVLRGPVTLAPIKRDDHTAYRKGPLSCGTSPGYAAAVSPPPSRR